MAKSGVRWIKAWVNRRPSQSIYITWKYTEILIQCAEISM